MGVLIRRALLVVNPASRRGGPLAGMAADALRAEGVDCDVLHTSRPGEGGTIALERARRHDAVFTLGGDGTAMEVVGALSGSGLAVGILPGGTGNLIARTLGIPLDVPRAVTALVHGARADVDLGRLADGRRFAFAAGIGIDAMMIERTPAHLKRRLGVSAYMLTAARAILRREQFAVRVTVDGVEHAREASAVMVANVGAVLNDLLHLGPGIRRDDGLLDVCLFSPRTLGDATRVLWRLWRKDFRPDPSLLYLPGRRIRVEANPPRMAQADGELIGPTPFEVEVEPGAARLLIPERRREGERRWHREERRRVR